MKNLRMLIMSLIIVMGSALTMLTSCRSEDENAIVSVDNGLTPEEKAAMPSKYRNMTRDQLEQAKESLFQKELDSISQGLKEGRINPEEIIEDKNIANRGLPWFSPYFFNIENGWRTKKIWAIASFSEGQTKIGIKNDVNSSSNARVRVYAFKNNGNRLCIRNTTDRIPHPTEKKYWTNFGVVTESNGFLPDDNNGRYYILVTVTTSSYSPFATTQGYVSCQTW